MKRIHIRYWLTILISTGLLIWPDCEEQVRPPDSVRLDLTITVLDTSILTQSLTGNCVVDSAAVFINSITYYNSLAAISDSAGAARFASIMPDRYNISVTRRFSADRVQQAIGARAERILNGQLQNVTISGESAELMIYLQPSVISDLVFSEIYYNGAPPPPPLYFHDQFTEIYNNSDSTVYLDSLIIADVEYGYVAENVIHCVHAYRFPGDGDDYPLAPGEFVIIAQDAIDHTQRNPNSINLADADFEYLAPGGDVDSPDVTNMIKLHHKYGIDFLYSVFNNALCLLRVSDPFALGYDNFDRLLLPKSAIIDAVEYRDNLAEMEYKRLDPTLDAGLTGGMEAYRGKSVQRRIDYYKNGRAVLMDNNNSSIDFQVIDRPTPRYFFDGEIR